MSSSRTCRPARRDGVAMRRRSRARHDVDALVVEVEDAVAARCGVKSRLQLRRRARGPWRGRRPTTVSGVRGDTPGMSVAAQDDEAIVGEVDAPPPRARRARALRRVGVEARPRTWSGVSQRRMAAPLEPLTGLRYTGRRRCSVDDRRRARREPQVGGAGPPTCRLPITLMAHHGRRGAAPFGQADRRRALEEELGVRLVLDGRSHGGGRVEPEVVAERRTDVAAGVRDPRRVAVLGFDGHVDDLRQRASFVEVEQHACHVRVVARGARHRTLKRDGHGLASLSDRGARAPLLGVAACDWTRAASAMCFAEDGRTIGAMEQRDPLDGIGAADAHLGRRVPLPGAGRCRSPAGSRSSRAAPRRGAGRMEPRRDPRRLARPDDAVRGQRRRPSVGCRTPRPHGRFAQRTAPLEEASPSRGPSTSSPGSRTGCTCA